MLLTKKYRIVFILIATLMIGCFSKPEIVLPNYEIKVKFLDAITNEPLSKVMVYVNGIERVGFFSRTTIAKGETGLDGVVNLKFKGIKNGIKYELKAESDYATHYIGIDFNYFKSDELIRNGKIDLVEYQEQRAELTIKYKNINPFDENDKIYCIISSFTGTLNSFGDYNDLKYKGKNVQGEFSINDAVGNRKTEILAIVTKNGVETRVRYNFVCKPFQNNVFELNY